MQLLLFRLRFTTIVLSLYIIIDIDCWLSKIMFYNYNLLRSYFYTYIYYTLVIGRKHVYLKKKKSRRFLTVVRDISDNDAYRWNVALSIDGRVRRRTAQTPPKCGTQWLLLYSFIFRIVLFAIFYCFEF